MTATELRGKDLRERVRLEIRGLFGELWFLAVWVLPHGHDQVTHWLGPMGARHDFGWPGLALEAKATTSVRGHVHVHRLNGVDKSDPPADGRLPAFSLRMREEPTASEAVVSPIETITTALGDDARRSTRSSRASFIRDTHRCWTTHYAEIRFRIVSERLYEVAYGFPRLSAPSFVGGLPAGIERVEDEVNVDACPQLIVASSPAEFAPGAPATAPPERAEDGGP